MWHALILCCPVPKQVARLKETWETPIHESRPVYISDSEDKIIMEGLWLLMAIMILGQMPEQDSFFVLMHALEILYVQKTCLGIVDVLQAFPLAGATEIFKAITPRLPKKMNRVLPSWT